MERLAQLLFAGSCLLSASSLCQATVMFMSSVRTAITLKATGNLACVSDVASLLNRPGRGKGSWQWADV